MARRDVREENQILMNSMTMKPRSRRFVCYIKLTISSLRSAPAPVRWLMLGWVTLILTPALPAQALVYQGLTNSALGSAVLVASGSTLLVSNLTSGGQDGVTMELGSPGQFVLNTFYQSPTNDGTLTITSLGYVSGQPGQPVGLITITYAGTNETYAFDFSAVGATTYTLKIFNGTELVYQSQGHSNSVPAYSDFKLEPLPMDDTEMGHFDENGNYHPGTTTSTKVLALPMNVGGQIVVGDRALAIPENPTNVVQALSGQSLQTSGTISNLVIAAESVTEGNVTLSGLGNATLNVASNLLTVANLGSTGQDGLAVQADNHVSDGAAKGQASDLEIHLSPMDAGNTLPVGAYLQAQLVGTSGGISNGVLGTLTVTKNATSNYLVSVDFSSIGATNNLVEAARGKGSPPPRSQALDLSSWSHGTSDPTALAQTTDLPVSFGFSYDVLTGNVSISIDWGNGTTHVSGGGASSVCDHLYVTPQALSLPSAPTGLQLVAAQVPGFTLTRGNATALHAGLHFLSMGNAILNLSSNQLTVANLGGSGPYGCAIEDSKNIADGAAKGQASEVAFHINPPDGGNTLPQGASMLEQLIGTGNGITNDILGTTTVRKAGTSNYVISADFFPVGQSNYLVQAYRNQVEVSSFQWGVSLGATLGSVDIFPLSLGVAYNSSSNTASLLLGWGTNAASLSANGTVVACDHLYITPDNTTVPGGPTGSRLIPSQIPSVTFNSVEVSPLLAKVSQTGQNLWLQWYGTSALQQSADLSAWSDVTNASSPYATTAKPSPTAPAKFYRLVFRP